MAIQLEYNGIFPRFEFQLSNIVSDGVELEIPVMRLWLTEDQFFDLNVDHVIEALNVAKNKIKKAVYVDIFDNTEERTILFIFNKEKNTIEYHISYMGTKIKSQDDIEAFGRRAVGDMVFDLTVFMNYYKDWLNSQFDEDGNNINAKKTDQ